MQIKAGEYVFQIFTVKVFIWSHYKKKISNERDGYKVVRVKDRCDKCKNCFTLTSWRSN